MMKKKFSKYTRKGLPGGANEVSSYTKGIVSTEGYRIDSPDKDNPVNVINSGNITMTETDGKPLKKGPLFGMDNLGNKQIMMPGFNYQFPGSQVLEMPIDNLREQLNPTRPASIPRPHPWGFLVDPKQAQGNVVGGVGVNFPRGLGFNATGVLPVSPDPVFKGVGSIGINQQFGNLNLGARIGTPVLRDYYTKELMFDPELSLSGRYTIPYTDKKKLSKRKLQPGGPVFGGFYNFGTPRTPEEWEQEIRTVEREIGNPRGWTMDDYNTMQDKLNEYKAWREKNTWVRDSSNKPNEYVVPLPPHLNAEKYIDAELSDKEIQELRDGGYVVEELPSYQDQGEVQDIPEVTVYPDEKGKKKQRKLLDNFQLAQAAFKKWHKDAGFGNLILKGKRDKDDIKSLKGYIDDYKEELKKTKEQYKPASSALRVLKENYPKEWKNLKLKHVFDPQSVEQLRKLYKEDKISDSAFRWYYDSFGKGYDKNVAKGTGPDATYSAKETKDIWRDTGKDWDKLGYGVNALMMGLALPATLTAADVAALGTAAATEGQMFGSFLRNPMPALRAIPTSTAGKITGTALTGLGLPAAAYMDYPNMQKAIKDKEYWDALGYGGMGLLNISPFAFPAIAKGYQAIKNAPKIKALKNLNVEAALSDVGRAKKKFEGNIPLMKGTVGTNQKPIEALKYDVAKNKVAYENYKKSLIKRIKREPTAEELNASLGDLQNIINQGEEALATFSKLKPDAQQKILNTISPVSPEMAAVKNVEKNINEILNSPNLKHISQDKKVDFINAIKIDSKVPEQFVRNLNEQSLATLKSKYGQNLEGLSSETRELILQTNIIPEGLLRRNLNVITNNASAGFFQQADYIAAGNLIREMSKLKKVDPSKRPYRAYDLAPELGANPKNLPSDVVNLQTRLSYRIPGQSSTSSLFELQGQPIGRGGVDTYKYATRNLPERDIKDINITRFDSGDFRFYEQTAGTGAKERTIVDEFGKYDRDQLGVIREDDLTKYIEKIDDGTIRIKSPDQGGFKTYAETQDIVTTGEVGLKSFKNNTPLDYLYDVNIPVAKGTTGTKTISLTNNEIKVVGQTGMDIEAVKRGEINKDYITHLTENITLTEQALPGSKVFGSAAGVKGAGLPHATHDIDVIMTADDFSKASEKYKQVTSGVDNKNTFKLKVFDNVGPQGEIDVNVIFKRSDDGTATGVLARELFRQFHPKKYYDAVMQQRKAYSETGVIPEMRISLTPDELLKSVDTEIKTIMDSFEAGAASGKTKHLFRDNVYASYADPKKFQKAQEMYLRSFVGPKAKIGRQFDASAFSDVSRNKEILKKIDFIGDLNAVANDPLKMQNALNTFTIENSTLMRGASFQGLKSGDDAVAYMNKAIGESSGPGARAVGEGLNTTIGISSSGYGAGQQGFQGFMQLNIDDLVNAKKLTPEEYVKALKIRSDGDIVLTEAMMNKVVEIANKHKALGLDEKALRNMKVVKAADLVDRSVINRIFKKGTSDKKLLADFYNDIAVAPELNFQAVHGTSGKDADFGTGYYRSGLKIFDEATDAMAIDFVAFNRSRTGIYAPDYKGRAVKDFHIPLEATAKAGAADIPSSSLIEGVEVQKIRDANMDIIQLGPLDNMPEYNLTTPTMARLESNQKDLKAMINLLDGGLIKAQQRRAEIMNDIKLYSKSKQEVYTKGTDAYKKAQQKKRTEAVKKEYNKLRLLEDELKNIDLKISEISSLKNKQAKVMSQYTKLLAVPTNIIEKSGVAEEPIRQTVDLVETGVEEGIEGVEKGVKEGTEAVVQFTEKVGESLKSRSRKRIENNKAVYKKLYGKDFSGPQMIDKNSEIKSDLRTLTPGYAKRFPTKYAEKLSQLIKLKEAGFQFYKEEEKKLNKLIKENKEEGGEVKYLTDEEIEMYRAGGYVVEEL